MIKLITPTEEYLPSYREAYAEYEKNGVTTYNFSDATSENPFKKYDDNRNGRNLASGYVGAHTYWLVDDERKYFIGKISIRHKLTPALERYGGHIGYGIRFCEWGHGYGTLMLSLALEKAKEIGLTEVLITCDDTNIASARVMEHNGLTLIDKIPNRIDGKNIITRRYHIVF